MSLNWTINNQQAKKYEFKELIPNSTFPDILKWNKGKHTYSSYTEEMHMLKKIAWF